MYLSKKYLAMAQIFTLFTKQMTVGFLEGQLVCTLLIFFWVLFRFLVTHGCAQGLLPALLSGITPGGSLGIMWDAKDRNQIGCIEGKLPFCYTVSLAKVCDLMLSDSSVTQLLFARDWNWLYEEIKTGVGTNGKSYNLKYLLNTPQILSS